MAATTRASARRPGCWRTSPGPSRRLPRAAMGACWPCSERRDGSVPRHAGGLADRVADRDRGQAGAIGSATPASSRPAVSMRGRRCCSARCRRSLRAARVLDYGCGSGVIGAATLAQEPSIVRRHAGQRYRRSGGGTRERARRHARVAGTRVADAGCTAYAAILSNPPLHQGATEDHTLLEQLVADAPSHLAPGGLLQIVVQRRLPLDRLLCRALRHADVVAENGRYRVWRARRER